MSGGAGYVLSKEALKIFVENGILDQNSNVCGKRLNIPEDVQMGKCLETLKVFNYIFKKSVKTDIFNFDFFFTG